MMPPDIVYCDQCGGASPRGSTACRFCGAALRPQPVAAAPFLPPNPDDPWADLVVAGQDVTSEDDAWADPAGTPWHAESEPAPTAVDNPAAAAPAAGAPGWGSGPPTLVETQGEPRRGLPGWAWAASVILLGSALGALAYIVVDRTDDGSVRTTDPVTTTSTSTTSTTSTTLPPTTPAPTTLPPTTVPIVVATAPATAPVTGPPTIPGAITEAPTVPTTVAATTAVPATAAPATAAPATPAPTTQAPTPAPTTAAPTTTTTTTPPTTVPGALPGDLGIAAYPMVRPACDGQYVTILASTKQTTASAMEYALRTQFPGAHYLRTDQSCPSLNIGASDGTPLYRIFAGPFPDPASACAARAQSTQGAFVKRVSDENPQHVVECPETV